MRKIKITLKTFGCKGEKCLKERRLKTENLGQWLLMESNFAPQPGDIWQYLETFLVVTTEAVNGKRQVYVGILHPLSTLLPTEGGMGHYYSKSTELPLDFPREQN